MRRILLLLTSVTFTILLGQRIVYGQTGAIKGTVKDAANDETIVGASVLIEGTTQGAATDLDGNFVIRNIRPGVYTLVVSFVSYNSRKIEGVTVENGKTTVIDTYLEDANTTLSELTITGTRMTNTEISIINEIKLSDMVLSGISAEMISRSQDSDAAQVMRRVPGVTIIDGRFVLIRGMAERYNPTLLHNAFAPSMETDVRSFSFDIIPSSQIDRMLVFKSPSAELPGDFAGGVVKIFTKNIPDENSLIIDYSTGYRHGTHFRDFDYQLRGQNHWLGFGKDFYNLPANFPPNLRRINNQEELRNAALMLNNDVWEQQRETAPLDQKFGVTFNRRFNLGNIKIGNITAVNYSRSRATFAVERNDFNAFNFNTNASNIIFNFNDDQFNENIRVGALFNWSLQIGDNHNIQFKNLYNHTGWSQYVFRTGFDFESIYAPNNHSFDKVYRGLYTGQLVGDHKFFDGRTTVEWTVGYGQSNRNQPDYKRYRSDLNDGQTILYLPPGASAAYFFGRFYGNMDEVSQTGRIDLTQRLGKSPESEFSVKAGFFYENKNRDFSARNIGYARSSAINFDISLLEKSIGELFQPQNLNNTTGFRIDEQSNPNDNYDASNRLMAGYVNFSLPLTKKLKLISGVRIESNLQRLNSFDFTNNPINVNNNIPSVLPSATLSYNFTEKMLVRAAYGVTVNRPEFREIAPFGFFDFNYNFDISGNPSLKVATIDNFDLRWEFYPNVGENVSVGVFYKNLNDPIENIYLFGAGSGGTKPVTFTNARGAYVYGVELDMRKSLAGMTGSRFVDHFSLMLNASLMKSRIILGDLSAGQSDNRPLQGQSPYIVNGGIYFDDPDKGWQVSANYNVIGRRIFLVGFFLDDAQRQGFPDVYEMPRHLIDLTISKMVTSKIQLKAGISDLLNNEVLLLQDGNLDGHFDRQNDQRIQGFRPGTVFSVGVSLRL